MVILIATQRSGTNMFRRVLGTHERIRAVPEVFNSSFDARDLMPKGVPFFLEYLLEQTTKSSVRGMPHARPDVLVEYLEMLETATAGKTAVVDVKYNSLHSAESVWSRPGGAPRLLRIFRDRGYRVIHLVRHNHLAVAVSLQRASKTGVFVVPATRPVATEKLVVDPNAVVRTVREMKEAAGLVRRWLQESGLSHQEVAYEDLFVNDPGSQLDSTRFHRIAEFIGVSQGGFDLVPETRKIAPRDLREEIVNIGELAAAFAGTEYEHCFSGPRDGKTDSGSS